MKTTGRTRSEDAELNGPDRRPGPRPHGPVRTPRNRDPREAGWVLPAASSESAERGGLKTEQKAAAKKIEVAKAK
jgi:hypothetical protein